MRLLERPVNGVGSRPIAIRSAATTMANAKDFMHDLEQLNVTVVRRKNIR